MRRALYVPNSGDVGRLCELAVRAEEDGWDGIFLWDHLLLRQEVVDPWIALSAMATRTSRILLGPMVTPVARRRPWKLALEAATLQRYSGGRLVLGVAAGVERDFTRFGERPSSSRLVEGLELMRKLWTGEPVTHHGRHFHVDDVAFRPAPPHIPIWVGGDWPRTTPFPALEHADGVFPVKPAGGGRFEALTPDEVRAVRILAGPGRNLAVWSSRPAEIDLEALAEAGATWWLADARSNCVFPS